HRTTSPGVPEQLLAAQRRVRPSMSAPDPSLGKPVRDSASEYSELALPTDVNGLGNLLGGKVMHLVDLAGAMAAMRHARRPVVTASFDHMNFLHPIHIGQLIVLHSQVNRVFRTSMEVGVKVMVEDLMTGQKRHTCSAYLTFVALDGHGKPTKVPPAIAETDEEKRRYREAGERREYRLALRNRSLG
ncbi:MAG: acyl-CoA thioesterase, partial [Bryobacteraceae bacterium]